MPLTGKITRPSFLRQCQLDQVQRVATLPVAGQPPLSPSVGTPLRTLWLSSKNPAGKPVDGVPPLKFSNRIGQVL